jgi:hypothetical protein
MCLLFCESAAAIPFQIDVTTAQKSQDQWQGENVGRRPSHLLLLLRCLLLALQVTILDIAELACIPACFIGQLTVFPASSTVMPDSGGDSCVCLSP